MFGSEMGELFVDVNNEFGVFAVSAQQHTSMNQEWMLVHLDLSQYGEQSNVTVKFRGVTGNRNYYDRGDMAIDNIGVISASQLIVNTFPYTEDFETGTGHWTNIARDNFDWTRRSGKTPTNYTGPNNAGSGTYYMYTEADKHLPSDTAIFEATFDFTALSSVELTFLYHMYGSETGTLFIDVNDDKGVFSLKEQQHYSFTEEWLQPVLDLSNYAGDTAVLRFRVVTGNTTWKDRGDISIDKVTIRERNPQIVSSYPYCESFETDLGSWINIGEDDFDWRRKTATTPTSYTGPNGASDGNHYLYAEADKHLPAQTSIFEANFDLSSLSTPELRFEYFMYGSEMGELSVDINDDLDVFHVSGMQHWSFTEDWTRTHIDLSPYEGQTIRVRFRAKTGNTTWKDRGDIAIDNICIGEPLAQVVTSLPYCESFESNMGYWVNVGNDQFDWKRRSGTTPTGYTGPGAAADGSHYIYIEADNNLPFDTAIFETRVDLSSATEPELSFYYHMYGSEMGKLYVDINNDKGVFEATGQQHISSSEDWIKTTFDLSDYIGQIITIRFRAITNTATWHDRGDIAVDNICIAEAANNVVDTYPYCESFESGYGNWNNITNDQFDWKRKSGNTPTSYTGPNTAAEGNYYFFAEADAHLPSDTAIFEANFDLSSVNNPEMSFMYFMYGSELGELLVEIDQSTTVFHVHRQQHWSGNEDWTKVAIDLSAYAGQTINVRVKAITSTATYHDRGDIAIDNFCVYDRSTKVISSYPYCESFENGLGMWDNIGDDNFDWKSRTNKTPTNYTGPSAAFDGTKYLYTECDYHLPSKTVILEATFDLSSISDPQFIFHYHMYGSETGQLFVDVNNDLGVFAVSGQEHHTFTDAWTKVTIDLSDYAGTTATDKTTCDNRDCIIP